MGVQGKTEKDLSLFHRGGAHDTEDFFTVANEHTTLSTILRLVEIVQCLLALLNGLEDVAVPRRSLPDELIRDEIVEICRILVARRDPSVADQEAFERCGDRCRTLNRRCDVRDILTGVRFTRNIGLT